MFSAKDRRRNINTVNDLATKLMAYNTKKSICWHRISGFSNEK